MRRVRALFLLALLLAVAFSAWALLRPRHRTVWQAQAPLPATVNTPRHEECEPNISPDGRFLLFTRGSAGHNTDLYVSARGEDGEIGPAKPLTGVNTEYDEIDGMLGRDGYLYFYSDRPGGFGGYDLYRARHNPDRSYAEPVNLGGAVNSPHNDYDPCLSPDGRFLYFSSNRHSNGSEEDYDLYVSLVEDGEWHAPRALRGINTKANEWEPMLSPDGRTLYFTSNRRRETEAGVRDDFDLYAARFDSDAGWTDPRNLGEAINTPHDEFDPCVTPEDEALLYVRGEREAEAYRVDIWNGRQKRVSLPPLVAVEGFPAKALMLLAVFLVGGLFLWLLVEYWSRLSTLHKCMLGSVAAHCVAGWLFTMLTLSSEFDALQDREAAFTVYTDTAETVEQETFMAALFKDERAFNPAKARRPKMAEVERPSPPKPSPRSELPPMPAVELAKAAPEPVELQAMEVFGRPIPMPVEEQRSSTASAERARMETPALQALTPAVSAAAPAAALPAISKIRAERAADSSPPVVTAMPAVAHEAATPVRETGEAMARAVVERPSLSDAKSMQAAPAPAPTVLGHERSASLVASAKQIEHAGERRHEESAVMELHGDTPAIIAVRTAETATEARRIPTRPLGKPGAGILPSSRSPRSRSLNVSAISKLGTIEHDRSGPEAEAQEVVDLTSMPELADRADKPHRNESAQPSRAPVRSRRKPPALVLGETPAPKPIDSGGVRLQRKLPRERSRPRHEPEKSLRIRWGRPKNLGPLVNTAGEDYEPNLSPDGETLFLTRGSAGGGADIMRSSKRNGKWSDPEPVDAWNSASDEIDAALNREGDNAAFYSNRPGGHGGYDIYISLRTEGDWSTPVNAGNLNSTSNEYDPHWSPDGRYLFFSSNRWSRSEEDYDLCYCEILEDGSFGPVQRLPFNSNLNEWEPALSRDGWSLYFTSNRPGGEGGYDIWVSRLQDGVWQPPENLGPGVNTERDELDPAVDNSGTKLYYATNRDGGKGSFDIWSASRVLEE